MNAKALVRLVTMCRQLLCSKGRKEITDIVGKIFRLPWRARWIHVSHVYRNGNIWRRRKYSTKFLFKRFSLFLKYFNFQSIEWEFSDKKRTILKLDISLNSCRRTLISLTCLFPQFWSFVTHLRLARFV